MQPMNNRIAYEIEMTEERLQEMLKCVKNAKDHMVHGQTFRLEIAYNVDFVFKGLVSFKGEVFTRAETQTQLDSGRAESYEGLK
jgi:hypothetical protein